MSNTTNNQTMDARQKALLMKWLILNNGDGTIAPLTLAQIRTKATAELGFSFTEAALRHYLESCEFGYTKRIASVKPVDQLAAQVEQLRAEVEAACSLMHTAVGQQGNPAAEKRLADVEKRVKELGHLFGWVDKRLAVVEKRLGLATPAFHPDTRG